jgi:hypothetical protein
MNQKVPIPPAQPDTEQLLLSIVTQIYSDGFINVDTKQIAYLNEEATIKQRTLLRLAVIDDLMVIAKEHNTTFHGVLTHHERYAQAHRQDGHLDIYRVLHHMFPIL